METTELETIATTLTEVLKRFNQTTEILESERQKQRWVPLSRISHYLGEGISPRMVADRIRAGILDHGIHYLNVSQTGKPHYVVCPQQIENFFMIPPEYRD